MPVIGTRERRTPHRAQKSATNLKISGSRKERRYRRTNRGTGARARVRTRLFFIIIISKSSELIFFISKEETRNRYQKFLPTHFQITQFSIPCSFLYIYISPKFLVVRLGQPKTNYLKVIHEMKMRVTKFPFLRNFKS